MSEKIEAGTMVWFEKDNGDWSNTKREFTGKYVGSGRPVVWDIGYGGIRVVNAIATIDPHAPKTPEWMPGEEYELWTPLVSSGIVFYQSPDKTGETRSPIELDRFHSFAAKAGDGSINLTNNPIVFTRTSGAISSNCFGDFTDRCEIIGAIMKKAQND